MSSGLTVFVKLCICIGSAESGGHAETVIGKVKVASAGNTKYDKGDSNRRPCRHADIDRVSWFEAV